MAKRALKKTNKKNQQIPPEVLAIFIFFTIFSIWNMWGISLLAWLSITLKNVASAIKGESLSGYTYGVFAGILITSFFGMYLFFKSKIKKARIVQTGATIIILMMGGGIYTMPLTIKQTIVSALPIVALLAWLSLFGLTIVKSYHNFLEDRDGGWTNWALTAGFIVISLGVFIGKFRPEGFTLNLVITTLQLAVVVMALVGVCIPRMDWIFSGRRSVGGHVTETKGEIDDDLDDD